MEKVAPQRGSEIMDEVESEATFMFKRTEPRYPVGYEVYLELDEEPLEELIGVVRKQQGKTEGAWLTEPPTSVWRTRTEAALALWAAARAEETEA